MEKDFLTSLPDWEHISCNRYNYCNVNYLAQLNIATSIKMTHQFHLRSTFAMLLTEVASVKLSCPKKSSQFLFPSLPHAALSLSQKHRNGSKQPNLKLNPKSEFLFPTLPHACQKHKNGSKQPDLKLGFKSCIEFKLWKQPYLWYLQSINI